MMTKDTDCWQPGLKTEFIMMTKGILTVLTASFKDWIHHDDKRHPMLSTADPEDWIQHDNTVDSQFSRLNSTCAFSCQPGHCFWQHWACFCTSHWMQLMGNRPGERSPTRLWGSSLTMAVTPSPWVRHGLLDDDNNNDRSVLHSTILKPMGQAWVVRWW